MFSAVPTTTTEFIMGITSRCAKIIKMNIIIISCMNIHQSHHQCLHSNHHQSHHYCVHSNGIIIDQKVISVYKKNIILKRHFLITKILLGILNLVVRGFICKQISFISLSYSIIDIVWYIGRYNHSIYNKNKKNKKNNDIKTW